MPYIFVDCEGHGSCAALNNHTTFEFGAVEYAKWLTWQFINYYFHLYLRDLEAFERLLKGER